jgi:hypothetical protein
MSVDDFDLSAEPELDARLRETLSRVAMTIGDTAPGPDTSPTVPLASAGRPRMRRWRPMMILIGVVLAAVPLAGFAYDHFWPDTVTEQTLGRLQKDALVSGGAEPNRYWVVPAFHTDACGQPMPGVELVDESANRVGAEWSTGGVAYGQPAPPTTNGRVAGNTPGCLRYDERVWLDAPSRFALTATRLGQHADPEDGSWGLLAAVHPAVHALRVTTPGSPGQSVATVPLAERPNGPRYAVIILPAQATRTQIVLLDEQGAPVPGGTRDVKLGR